MCIHSTDFFPLRIQSTSHLHLSRAKFSRALNGIALDLLGYKAPSAPSGLLRLSHLNRRFALLSSPLLCARVLYNEQGAEEILIA